MSVSWNRRKVGELTVGQAITGEDALDALDALEGVRGVDLVGAVDRVAAPARRVRRQTPTYTSVLSELHGGWQAVDVVPGGSVRPR